LFRAERPRHCCVTYYVREYRYPTAQLIRSLFIKAKGLRTIPETVLSAVKRSGAKRVPSDIAQSRERLCLEPTAARSSYTSHFIIAIPKSENYKRGFSSSALVTEPTE
jgi:hypothetical protein